MKMIMGFLKRAAGLVLVLGIVFVLFQYYSYIFSRTVIGRIDNVARVTGVTAMIGGSRSLTEDQLHAFSVSIRQPNGEMLTATSVDGQWAIAKAGLCVKAKYYPHPPWDLKQAGTYFNARLLTMADCASQAAEEMGIQKTVFEGVPLTPSAGAPSMPADVPVTSTPVPPPSMETAP
ncbi:MAG: hypothetical protein J0L82_07565 [Deltaproteobacteria bacterium]|nr:hypothetical protein [Deltaproteobacteria bacterium]